MTRQASTEDEGWARMPTPRAPKLTRERDPMDFRFWVWRPLTKPTFLIKAGKSFLLTCLDIKQFVQFGDFKNFHDV